MFDFIGHLHPLFVHLPIGILVLAILFEWLPTKKKYRFLKRSIQPILLIGSATAILSCLTGYLLSLSGEYESDTVGWHQWMAITLTIYSLGYAWMRSEKSFSPYHKTFSAVLLLLLMITGHLGGSLTHGEGYLAIELTSGSSIDLTKVNLQQAVFYEDLVKPILEDRCYGCHGTSKQKGKLRLDEAEHILKGGKGGVVIVPGKADESELIHRLLLPVDDEDHMPPKEKQQLDEKEIEILKTWIASGADFKKSVIEAGQLEGIEKIISAEKTIGIADLPSDEVPAADASAISQLQKLGVVIIPVSSTSNYLSANLINASALDSAVDLLSKVKEQLVWLKAGEQPLADNHLAKISLLTHLTRLNLDHTKVTDAGLAHLKSLNALTYLNLNNTTISSAGISNLASLNLQSLYLYKTNIPAEEIANVKKILPNTTIELGDLQVPLLASDTTEAKAPPSN